jgi:protein kinase-like protein
MSSGCLQENEVQAFLGGVLPSARIDGVESHLDACLKCQLLVSAGVRTASLRTHGLDGESAGRLHFEVGDVVSSRYEITRYIARGGMGEVYAAHDRMLGDEIGLKVLLRPASAGAGALDRLRAEVQLARRVADPHVLRVFDLGSYQGPDGGEVLFLTMQLLPGETLRARIRRAGPLSPPETWRLAGDMFAALGAAHQIGIVHRDFKSDNVMLVPTADGPPRAVVMDFGLAQAATDAPLKNDGTPLVAGTLGYMAPEQLAGGVVTAAVDVYAFGVVLHEMLTGVLPPFRPEIARKDRTAPPPPPPSLLDRLDIPPRWSALIRRCLERDPAARFRNILEARDAVASGRRERSRHAIFVAVGAAAALAAAGGVLWQRGGPRTVPPVAATVAASPPASPPVAPSRSEPARPIPAAAPVPGPGQTDRAGRSKPPRLRVSTRVEAKSESAPRTPPETGAPIAPRPKASIADTDEAIDPFRESR